MGTGAGKGLNFGNTKGSQKEKELNPKDYMSELQASGVKFTKEDVIFVTKDKTGQLVWLEKGNKTAGLEHILNGDGNTTGHAQDFEKAFGVNRSQLPEYLNNVISRGQIVSNEKKLIGSRLGFERIYDYKGQYYVLTGIGTNGFIVSAYPITK